MLPICAGLDGVQLTSIVAASRTTPPTVCVRTGARYTTSTFLFALFIPYMVVVLTLTRIMKSVVTGQAPVTLELRNAPGKEYKQPKVVHAYQVYHSWRNSFLHQKHIEVKSGVSLRCARSIRVHISYYSPLRGEIDYTACHPRNTTTHILHVAFITAHTHDRRKSIEEKKREK